MPMEIRLNLTSKIYLNRQSIRLWLMIPGIFLLLSLLLSGLYGYQNLRQLSVLDERFKELNAQVTGLQGTPEGYSEESYAAVVKELAMAREIVAADQFRWTDLLSRFEELVPADVSIRSIQPDFKEHSVQLACVARDLAAMTQFLDSLLASRDLNQVFLLRHAESENETDGPKQLQVDFNLVIREAF
jgi:hypothetical protein